MQPGLAECWFSAYSCHSTVVMRAELYTDYMVDYMVDSTDYQGCEIVFMLLSIAANRAEHTRR